MGARAVNDAVSQRGVRPNAHEDGYGACEYVAVGWGRVALGEETEAGEGDDSYVSVCVFYIMGDIVLMVYRSPANPTHTAIKRVIGLPGDRIITREPCMKPSQIVPFNHVWLEGDADDPRKSLDSNTYGPVSISLITGRVLAVAWPRWRWLQWSDWEKGVVEGDEQRKLGIDYRKDVRDRVLKGAVQLERPMLE